jgi:hypothetical protein
MKRSDLEHLLRAAGKIIGDDRIIVVGSQAVLATVPEFLLPPEATASVGADLIPLDDPDERLADKIDGTIGEASVFHETFGIYAQGVGYDTITGPQDWRYRLIEYSNENTGGVTGLCLEINDLWLSKLAAGRAKDFEFCRALARERLVAPTILRQRAPTVRGRDGDSALLQLVDQILDSTV